MVEMEERELLASLRVYLEELKESGVEELPFGESSPSAAPVPAQASPAQETLPFSVGGAGNPQARLLFVRAGAALAPASEELLGKIIGAMGFAVTDVYMLDYTAEDGEAAGLREAVLGKISSVAPEAVVALGEAAAQLLLKRKDPVSALRGRFVNVGGAPVMATLHPDQLVADEGLKRQVWVEMKQVMARLAG